MEKTTRKTLKVIAKNDFEKTFQLLVKPLSKEALNDEIVELTFNDSEAEINKLSVEICEAMIAKAPSDREVLMMADKKGIVYDERPKPKRNCGISMLHNMEASS